MIPFDFSMTWLRLPTTSLTTKHCCQLPDYYACAPKSAPHYFLLYTTLHHTHFARCFGGRRGQPTYTTDFKNAGEIDETEEEDYSDDVVLVSKIEERMALVWEGAVHCTEGMLDQVM